MTRKDNRPGGDGAASATDEVNHDYTALAQRLAANGLHVFPVDHPDQPDCIGKHHPTKSPCDGSRGKHPAVAWKTWSATNTLQMIYLEWAKHGGVANIGIACGPSNLVVLDEDQAGEIERWAVTHGFSLPDTYTVTTGRGRHLCYRWNHSTKRIGNSPRAMDGYKIDVRGFGGYVVAEGSKHASGAVYTGNGAPVADLPDDVAEYLLNYQRHAEDSDRQGIPAQDTGSQREHVGIIRHGDRHYGLVSYAGRLRSKGLTLTEAEAVFKQRWLDCEQPEGQIPEARYHGVHVPYPVTWDEAKAKLADVFGRYSAPPEESPAGGAPASMALTRLADVVPEKVSWLWPGRIPAGKPVTLDGDPGVGKSTVALDIAATITTGGTWPDGSVCKLAGAVLIMSAEDGLADTVRPRCDAAGADVTQVYAIEGAPILDKDGKRILRPPTLADIEMLKRAIKRTAARLLIIDVIMAYLPNGSDSHKDQDIRAVLSRLAALADETGCTILLLRHLNKTGGRDPLYRGGGSIGIVGAARAGLLIAPDPDDPDRRVLASVKSNLGPTPDSLAYRLVESGDHGVARVQWEGVADYTARSLLDPPDRDDDEFDDHDYTNDLKASWLYRYLDEAHKAQAEIRPKDAVAYAADKGIGRASVFRLFNVLANAGMVQSVDGKTFPRVTHWRLVTDDTTGDDPPRLSSPKTTETTGPDLHKQGETIEELPDQRETIGETIAEQAKQPHGAPVVSVVSPNHQDAGMKAAPPGAPTPDTPGYNDRVRAALAKAGNGGAA